MKVPNRRRDNCRTSVETAKIAPLAPGPNPARTKSHTLAASMSMSGKMILPAPGLQTARHVGCLLMVMCVANARAEEPPFSLRIEQITFGTKHHFFGYIGQCQTIPWNGNNRFILGLEIDNIDRMPKPEEAAEIFLLDTANNNEIVRLDKTHAWNPQQGTMFYWNPLAPNSQFLFNDRDVRTGKVF